MWGHAMVRYQLKPWIFGILAGAFSLGLPACSHDDAGAPASSTSKDTGEASVDAGDWWAIDVPDAGPPDSGSAADASAKTDPTCMAACAAKGLSEKECATYCPAKGDATTKTDPMCMAACAAKGLSEKECEPYCPAKGSSDPVQDCTNACLKKGTDKATCEQTCAKSGDGATDPTCMAACKAKGVSEAKCKGYCPAKDDTKAGS